jgi:hypothetical protein
MNWWHAYWSWVGGNIGAMPLEGAVAFLAGAALRKPLARWWRRHFANGAELAEIRDLAAKAHRIAADTYWHHVGQAHPDAPGRRE